MLVLSRPAALGQKQPVSSLPAQGLLTAKSGHIDIHGQIGLGGLEVNCIAILLMAAFIESLRSTMSKKSIYVVGPDGRVRRGVLLQLGQCGIYLRYKASLVYSSPKGGCLLFKIGNHLLI